MLNVQYNIAACDRILHDMAAGFSAAYGRNIYVKGNRLIFPKTLADGRLECYNVDKGLALLVIDCTFFEDIHFIRIPVSNNDFHSIAFNLVQFSLMVNCRGKEKQLIGESWKDKILYSSTEVNLSWKAPKGIPMKIVVLLLSREWLVGHYPFDPTKSNALHHKALLEGTSIEFTLDLNLEILLLTREIINEMPPAFLSRLFYKGYAMRLLALTVAKTEGHSQGNTILKYRDVVHVVNVRQKIENHLPEPLPVLDDLAKKCGMSRSKFATIFKAMYGKSYLQFFQDLRIAKAAALLKDGHEIIDTANAVGFGNQSHFTRVFKSYFNLSPKAYRDAARKR
ncbi:MAG: helix-turn-helix transcriptional regulator [Filimonas sp.]|nr:helix-turn-helix transcriptional regulator [Filimonas sp.]